MKLPLPMRTITCIIIIAASSLLLSCKGRAKIVETNNNNIFIDTRLDVTGYTLGSSCYINGYLHIDNYYGDDFSYMIDLDECGFLHRQKGKSESANKEYSTTLTSSMTRLNFDCKYYKEGMYVILTPFVRNDDRTFFGQSIELEID